jgi:methyl-accepting chemotaxis protein
MIFRLSAKLADVSRNASQAFEQYRDRFASTDEVLARTFQNLVTGVQDLSREANKAVSDMQGQLAQAIGLLRTGIEEIDETVGNMQATAERLERAMGARVAGVRS